MKVVHIALTDSGGAGMGMMTLHHALLAQGIDSKVLVAIKHCNEAEVVSMQPNLHTWGKTRMARWLQRAACRMGVCLTPYDKWHRRVYKVRRHHPISIYSMPITQYDVLCHPVVKAADVIHLHFAADFVDFPSFFPHVDKPVVWTLRDENPMLGGFHFTTEKKRLYPPYALIEDAFVTIKRKAIDQCKRLHVVLLSSTTEALLQQTDYLSCRPYDIIYNAIETNRLQPCDRALARTQLGIAADDVVLSFACLHLDEERKGLRLVTEAIQRLHNKRVKLLCGGQMSEALRHALPDNVITLGPLNSQQLSTLYSVADLFINASAHETFGKTIIEALCCGTPVVSTAVGIAPKVINQRNGVICHDRSVEGFVQSIEQALATKYDNAAIRQQVLPQFDAQLIAQRHKVLYEKVLAN